MQVLTILAGRLKRGLNDKLVTLVCLKGFLKAYFLHSFGYSIAALFQFSLRKLNVHIINGKTI